MRLLQSIKVMGDGPVIQQREHVGNGQVIASAHDRFYLVSSR